ncbi:MULTISPECIES: TetR/AcrR family transcriptional regulator [unclassified Fusibacter]|uniref:TetR/AcrR family transcriptional regulator n=1 Tax=unclassified Fusibacter TaxID=2624464 RepID=UPI00101367FA|nr:MULTISPECIES: TetR/AcrR family transcriptional regulator [unclassified Fusibacter]MCK8058980.1 TetR/AcrR family transcriptional regulator [Fusibacter sp. A2]NPE22391.1 TetR/AcrR family transcriptional regulator [Fusibacter sp. A1]RXV60498.1 TetR/AcrR family transcriptional regulator [Fusibacter sp. A1]
MANSRFIKLDKEKKDNILYTALTEFASKGFTGSSINQISKQAGLSAGHLYYYFENKEDLYLTVVDFVFDELIHKEDEEPINFWMRVEQLVRSRVMLSRKNKEIGRFLNRFFDYAVSHDGSDVELLTMDKVQNEFRRIFELGIQSGEIRCDLPQDYLFQVHLGLVLTTNRWILTHIDKLDDAAMDKFISDAVGLIRLTMGSVEEKS